MVICVLQQVLSRIVMFFIRLLFIRKNKIVSRQGRTLDDQAVAYWLSIIKMLTRTFHMFNCFTCKIT